MEIWNPTTQGPDEGKDAIMGACTHWLLVGAGFLAGTAGIKFLKSRPFHDAMVAAAVQGMKAKAEYEGIVEAAKAQYDDIMAEADFRVAQEGAEAKAE